MEFGNACLVVINLLEKLMSLIKMAGYKCTICHREFDGKLISRRIRCPYCNSKVLLKKNDEKSEILYKSL